MPWLGYGVPPVMAGAPVGDTLNLGGGAAITPVPEPSTFAAIAGGLALAIAGWRRRRA